MNEKTSKEAVSRYYQKWAEAACVDKRVLRDWKEAMYSCIDERIKILQQLHINKRKKQVLKSKVHLDYLNKLHDNFVLVPTDKANNNVIVYGVPFVSKLKMMLVFTIHAGIYDSCWYL